MPASFSTINVEDLFFGTLACEWRKEAHTLVDFLFQAGSAQTDDVVAAGASHIVDLNSKEETRTGHRILLFERSIGGAWFREWARVFKVLVLVWMGDIGTSAPSLPRVCVGHPSLPGPNYHASSSPCALAALRPCYYYSSKLIANHHLLCSGCLVADASSLEPSPCPSSIAPLIYKVSDRTRSEIILILD
ncbi:hypothetical protein Sjap_015704 [Stephania japonica]|uniref:Uncharacterized protein n=1 Tax=Stephania japonica TaxID=461633 RepID=A0AAP0IJX6_9MAGN